MKSVPRDELTTKVDEDSDYLPEPKEVQRTCDLPKRQIPRRTLAKSGSEFKVIGHWFTDKAKPDINGLMLKFYPDNQKIPLE